MIGAVVALAALGGAAGARSSVAAGARSFVAASALPSTGVGAPVRARASAAVDGSRGLLRGFICQPAVVAAQRELYVQAVMRPLPGTIKMEMRFALLRRGKGARSFAQVAGPNLGNWISPLDPTLGQRPGDQWIVDHPVVGLPAPADYRLEVAFRWQAAAGRLLATQVRLSATCSQPLLGPDLLVQSITVVPVAGTPALDEYIARIANAGARRAGAFEVRFTDGSVVQSRTVAQLKAHRTRLLYFSGPACNLGSQPTVTVDPGRRRRDLNRADNTLAASCPALARPLHSVKQ